MGSWEITVNDIYRTFIYLLIYFSQLVISGARKNRCMWRCVRAEVWTRTKNHRNLKSSAKKSKETDKQDRKHLYGSFPFNCRSFCRNCRREKKESVNSGGKKVIHSLLSAQLIKKARRDERRG